MAEFVNQNHLDATGNSWRLLSERRRGALRTELGPLAGLMGSAFGVALIVGVLTSMFALGTVATIFVMSRSMGRHKHVVLSQPKRPTSLQVAAEERPMQPGRIEQVNVVHPVTVNDASRGEDRAASEPNETEKAQRATKKLLEEQIHVVTAGRQWLSKRAGYTATFVKRERVQDVLNPAEKMRMILRHVPFAVRLDWPESGQRVAYVD